MSRMVDIHLKNLTKYFGSVRAVEDLTLKVNDKEFMVLLGPSGCGKTTTLRLIAGLERPAKGHVYFGDKLMDYVAVKDRNVSMVFQSYALFPHMRVFHNIAFPLSAAGWTKEDKKKRVREVAEMLRIGDLLKRKPHELSGGQKQRVALGRALVRKPDVLLLDEPLANLDARLRVVMRGEIKRLQRDFESTTVYVTHDQIEAMSLADRIAVLNDGWLRQVGTPDELYGSPSNVFVAGFMGSPSMNLLDCSFVEEGGLLDFASFTIHASEDLRGVLRGHTELIFGIRPRDVKVPRKKIPDAIESKVYVVEPLGEETIMTLDIKGTTVRAVTSPTFRARIGRRVWISFNLNKVHIFDRKTREVII